MSNLQKFMYAFYDREPILSRVGIMWGERAEVSRQLLKSWSEELDHTIKEFINRYLIRKGK